MYRPVSCRFAAPVPLVALALGACATSGLPPDKEIARREFVDVPAGTASSGAGPDPSLPASWVDGATGLRELCDVLRNEERSSFPGNEVARARARDAHRTRRQQASAARYQIEIPARGFAFGGYDLTDERLTLASGSFIVDDGAELYRPAGSEPILFPLGADAAQRILELHEGGAVSLRLVFQPAPSEMRDDLCLRLGGGIVKLAADVVAAYLTSGQGTRLAAFETQAFAQTMAQTRAVEDPAARVSQLMAADGSESPASALEAARALEPRLLDCYRAALRARPGLRGKLAVSLDVGKDATLRNPRVQVSSLGDEALATCVSGVLDGARLPGARAGGLYVTVELGPR